MKNTKSQKRRKIYLASAVIAGVLIIAGTAGAAFADSVGMPDIGGFFANLFSGSSSYGPADFTAVPEKPQLLMGEKITIDGVDVSGLSLQEARIAVAKNHSKILAQEASLKIAGSEINVPLTKLGIEFEDGICEKVITYGQPLGPLMSRYKTDKDLADLAPDFTTTFTVNEEKLTSFTAS